MSINDIVIVVLIILSAISGIVSGFVKKSSRIVSLGVAGVCAFYLGSTISDALVNNIASVQEWVAQNDVNALAVLIGSYLSTFIIALILVKIILKLISTLLENMGGIGAFLDKGLGLVAGVCIGFVLADIYVWCLYGVSCINADTAEWVINDAKLYMEGTNSLTQLIMNMNLGSIGQTFPSL